MEGREYPDLPARLVIAKGFGRIWSEKCGQEFSRRLVLQH